MHLAHVVTANVSSRVKVVSYSANSSLQTSLLLDLAVFLYHLLQRFLGLKGSVIKMSHFILSISQFLILYILTCDGSLPPLLSFEKGSSLKRVGRQTNLWV